MTVLVTGGSGYIGTRVVDRLVKRSQAVVVVDIAGHRDRPIQGVRYFGVDVQQTEQLRQIIEDYGVTEVIHLAAVKDVETSTKNPLLTYNVNIGGLLSLMRAITNTKVNSLVFASSAAVYKDGVVEGFSHESDIPSPISAYGRSKLMGEQMIADYAAATGIRATALRYFNVIGVGEIETVDESETALLGRLIAAAATGERAQIHGSEYDTGDGTAVRDYIDVNDVAVATVRTLELQRDVRLNGPYNIGTGVGTTVLEMVMAVERATGADLDPELLEERDGDIEWSIATIKHASTDLGWSAHTSLADSVSATVKAVFT